MNKPMDIIDFMQEIDDFEVPDLAALLAVETEKLNDKMNWPTENNINRLNAQILAKYVVVKGVINK